MMRSNIKIDILNDGIPYQILKGLLKNAYKIIRIDSKFFYYQYKQLMNCELTNPQTSNTDQITINDFDFNLCRRMKKLTTHDLFLITVNNNSYVVKCFPSSHSANYEQELNILSKMETPSILKIVANRKSHNTNTNNLFDNSHIIVLKQAKKGDLNDYLPKYGRFNQKAARTIFRQIIQGLAQAYKHALNIIHPNLLASSILLNQNGQVKICGWSGINNQDKLSKLHQCIFSCGQILICLLTTYMPFYKRYSSTDTFYKFINPTHIHKFWSQIKKKINKSDKNFEFSLQFKQLIQNIFLKRYLTFQQIIQSKWYQNSDIFTFIEFSQFLKDKELQEQQKLNARKKKQAEYQQKRKRMLHQYQIKGGNNRCNNSEQQLFIQDYEEGSIEPKQLQNNECFSLLRIEDADPNFVIASLKDFFRNQKGKVSIMLCEQFVLYHHKVVKVNNYAIIELSFQMNFEDEDNQPIQVDEIALKLKLGFMRNQSQEYYVEFEVLETNFSIYYTNRALKFLEQRIQNNKVANLNKY